MKYFKWLAAIVLMVGFVLVPSKASAVPPNFMQGGNSFGEDARLGTNDAFSLIFETGNLEAMRIDTSGNVGMGTASPQERLHLSDGNFIIESGSRASDLILLSTGTQLQPGNVEFRNTTDQLATISYESGESGLYLQVPNAVQGGYGAILLNKLQGNIVIGDAASFYEPEGTLQVVREDRNSSLVVGASGNNPSNDQSPGCLVIGDSDGIGVTYVTANDGILTSSIIKPSICD